MGEHLSGRKTTLSSDFQSNSLKAEQSLNPQLCVHTTDRGCLQPSPCVLHSRANCPHCQGSPRAGEHLCPCLSSFCLSPWPGRTGPPWLG